MKAAVVRGKDITIEDYPEPKLTPGRLLVEPLAVGICGSDLHLREEMAQLADSLPPEQLPGIVPGHEFVSRIVAVGSDVPGMFKPGMRVVANPFTIGPEGPECIGLSPTFSGGIASLSCVDAVRAIPVPDAVPDSLAALTEPLAVGIRAVDAANRYDGPNLVLGCGPVGLSVILALKAQGKGPIIAADYSATRRALAEMLGADIVIDPTQYSPWEQWGQVSFEPSLPSPLLDEAVVEDRSVNIFECVGAPGLIDQVTNSAPSHAHVIVVGVCSHEDKFTPINGITRELTLEFSFAYRMSQFRRALDLIAAHPEQVEKFVTSELPLSATKAGFDLLQGNPEEIKVMILPQKD